MSKAAYEESYFDYLKRNETAVIRHMKVAFVHAQIAFCDNSLGTKVHINVQNINNPIFIENKRYNMYKTKLKTLQPLTKKEMAKDPSTDLMVYFVSGGGGVAYVGWLSV